MVYIVNVLEVDQNDKVTTNILSSYIIKAKQNLEAIKQAGKQWKKHPKYSDHRHNFFLQVNA